MNTKNLARPINQDIYQKRKTADRGKVKQLTGRYGKLIARSDQDPETRWVCRQTAESLRFA